MKLFLSSFVFIFFCYSPLFGEEIKKKYILKIGGIKIGELNWEINLELDNYLNKLNLESRGLLSSLYSFKGEYFSIGTIHNNELLPKKYTHFWKTRKAVKSMELNFSDKKLISINQTPAEKEKIRLNIFAIENTNDPLTSFLKILMGENNILVVDGRRFYTMKAKRGDGEQVKVTEIVNYSNLWADHNRNKFEKIIFEKKNNAILPKTMLVYFDGKVFRLEEN